MTARKLTLRPVPPESKGSMFFFWPVGNMSSRFCMEPFKMLNGGVTSRLIDPKGAVEL